VTIEIYAVCNKRYDFNVTFANSYNPSRSVTFPVATVFPCGS
jgi:hypothetical protein